jgi:hypothetical protein
MLRYFAVFFLGVLLSSCNINKKKEQKPSGYLSLANADSLFTDFEKESDSTIKLKKGLVLDSLLFKSRFLGKWASVKIH